MAKVQKNTDGTVTVTFTDGHLATFSAPTETHLGLALSALKKDPLGMVDVLVDNCLVSGDKERLKGEVAYCKQLQDVLDEVFGKVDAELAFEGDKVLVSFADGTNFLMKKCDRATYSESRVKSSNNPISGIKHVLKACVLPDDGLDPKTFSRPGILLGFSVVAEDFLEYTGRSLGN